jgi:hypothetical protein
MYSIVVHALSKGNRHAGVFEKGDDSVHSDETCDLALENLQKGSVIEFGGLTPGKTNGLSSGSMD